MLRSKTLAGYVAAFMARPNGASERERVADWLNTLLVDGRYDAAMVFDGQGHLRLRVPASAAATATALGPDFHRALASRDAIITELYRGTDERIHLDILAPIRSTPSGRTPSRPSAALAVITLRVDPTQFLFPLIQSWPVPSTTAETLLVRHGFPDGGPGEVLVTLHRSPPGHIRREGKDTGRGLPPDFDARQSQSLGLQLVSDLVRQLGGTLDIGRGPGASFTITFNPRRHPSREIPAV